MKKRRIGIYGGKFDPPHNGHLMCAELTRDNSGLDKVLFVVSANPPHKDTGVTDARLRLEMVEAACAPNCYFEACDVELKRPGKSWTYPTVVTLSEKYGPDVELCLMMSSEYLDPEHAWTLRRWQHYEELISMVTLLVFMRPGHTAEQTKAWGALHTGARIEYLTYCPAPPVSSTEIRDRVSKGLSIWYMVLPEVWQIIRARKLYGCTMPERGSLPLKLWRRLSVTAKRYWHRLHKAV